MHTILIDSVKTKLIYNDLKKLFSRFTSTVQVADNFFEDNAQQHAKRRNHVF